MKNIILNLPEKSGIYKIVSPTGRVYIGESNNLKIRCKNYLYPSKIKKQRAIYNSLIKHGVQAHEFEVIEFCEVIDLKIKERYYQEKYNSIEVGLNCVLTKTDTKSQKHSDKTKKIMSEKSKGDKNAFYGKKHTEETLKKLSEASSGENNPNFGGKLKNDDWILKQSISNSKKPIKVFDTETSLEYTFINSKECGKSLNVSPGQIRQCKNNYKLQRRYIITDL